MNRILLTGGFGYIGSHTAAYLAEKNKDFLIYDNFLNSKYSVIERLEKTINKNIEYVTFIMFIFCFCVVCEKMNYHRTCRKYV